MLKFLILVGFLSSGAAYSQEGFFMDGNLFYFQKEEERSNNAGTATNEYSTENLFLGLGICYRTGSLCFGGKYLRGEIGAKNSSGIFDGNIELEGFGVSAGYLNNGFVFQASYMLEAEKRYGDAGVGGDTTEEYPAKEAFMVDMGYGFNVSGFFVGPSLKWFQFKYDERTLNGQSQSLAQTEKDSYLLPMFSFWTFL